MALAISEQLIEIREIPLLKKSFHCPGIYAGSMKS